MFRNLFSLIVIAPFLWRSGLPGLRSALLPLHVARALLKLGSLICFYYAIMASPLALVTAIAFTAPLFVTMGSVTLLGEPLRAWRIVALLLGFAGVLVVVRPGASGADFGVVLAIISAVGLGAVGLLMKFVSVREAPGAVVSLNILLTVPASLLLALPVWSYPSPAILGLMAAQGLLGGIAQLSISSAMKLADASILSPLEFSRLPLVVLLAWWLFGEATDLWTIIGAVLIFALTLTTVFGEKRPATGSAAL